MITHRIGRPLQAVGCPLVIVLAAALAAAQGPPDQPPGPPDQSPGPAAGRPDGGGPDWPMFERRFGGQWQGQGQQFRTRASEPAAQRLDALEAKLDTLLNEVRQLRREINRQRVGMSSRRPGPRYGQGPPQGPYRGEFRRDGQRPPDGPPADFSPRRQFQPPFDPPFGRPGFAPPDRRGPAGRHQGPPPVREFGPGPGPRFDGPPGWFGPPPRNRRGDSDARDQRPDGPAMRMSIAVPVGTATTVVRMVPTAAI